MIRKMRRINRCVDEKVVHQVRKTDKKGETWIDLYDL